MYRYRHGGNAVFETGGYDILDLSANINPLGFPTGVKDTIINQIPLVTRYPDSLCRLLRREIAGWEQVDPDWIFCGNGASDIIFRLSVCVRPKAALLPAPTFSDYERSLKSSGTEIYYHHLREEHGFCIDDSMVQSISDHYAEMVFICNPNNPTGVLTERSVIEEILSCCEPTNTLVVVDECFIDFVENAGAYTAKPLLAKYNNLIILKAFTKIFALPGIRLGYAICGNSRIIERLYECGPDWAVSNIAQAAGIAAVRGARNSPYLSETVSFVTKERAFIKNDLERMNFAVFDSRANYVFFRNPKPYDLFEKLNETKIRIRHCGNYIGLSSDYCRVAVSTTQNNQKFIGAVRGL